MKQLNWSPNVAERIWVPRAYVVANCPREVEEFERKEKKKDVQRKGGMEPGSITPFLLRLGTKKIAPSAGTSATRTLFEATIPSTSLRPFFRILVGLSRISDELYFEASSSKVKKTRGDTELTVGTTFSDESFLIGVWDGDT